MDWTKSAITRLGKNLRATPPDLVRSPELQDNDEFTAHDLAELHTMMGTLRSDVARQFDRLTEFLP